MTDESPVADADRRDASAAAADALADALPAADEMELRQRLVLVESRLGNHHAAILLLAAGVVLLSIITILRTRKDPAS